MLAAQTLGAASSGELLADKPEIDFLLRLAGTTQISKAIKYYGARPGAPFLLVVASRIGVRGASDLVAFELPKRDITVKELARVEKAALLNVKRS